MTIFTEHTENIMFPYMFWEEPSCILQPKKKYLIFKKKKCHLYWWYKKVHIPVLFSESFRNENKKRKHGFSCGAYSMLHFSIRLVGPLFFRSLFLQPVTFYFRYLFCTSNNQIVLFCNWIKSFDKSLSSSLLMIANFLTLFRMGKGGMGEGEGFKETPLPVFPL